MTTYAVVGKPTQQITAPSKVTGNTPYPSDVQLPRMVHVKVFRSPVAHARIKRLDVSRARAYPGVVTVLVADDLPAHLARDSANRVFTLLAQREIVFYGQPVAFVVAETAQIAEEARDLIELEYDELPVVLDVLQAVDPSSPPVRYTMEGVDRSELRAHTTVKEEEEEAVKISNVTQRMIFSRGDVEQGFAEADLVVERTYRAQWVHQGYIEPMAAVVDIDAGSGELTIWTGTQGLFGTRETVAKVLGIPESKINVQAIETGGAFGAKLQPFAAAVAAFVATKVQRPVRYVLTRSEDLRAADPAPQAYFEVKTGVKKDGTVTALKARAIYDCGSFPGSPLMAGSNLLGAYYKWPNLEIEGLEVITNRVSQGALRAPGTPQATFAIDSQMDIMAQMLDMDPLEFRLKNAVVEGDLMPNGRSFTRIGLRECLGAMKETEFWKNRNNLGANEAWGIAVGGWLGGLQPASAIVALNSDGSISVLVGAADITGTNTSFQMIAAEVMSLPLHKVSVRTGATGNSPYAGASAGSKTLRTVGGAVFKACEDARDQMFRIAAQRLEANSEDLELAGGAVRVKGSPEKALTFQLLATMTQGFGATYPMITGRGNIGSPTMAPGFTVQGVKVYVDPDTGEITVKDACVVQDVGFAINPTAVENQLQGGLYQSLGIGFTEEMIWNDKGILLNPSLLDYRQPVSLDIPKIEVKLVEVPTNEPPFGAKGVGEPPISAGCAALANAAARASGARVYQLPVTAERILRAKGQVQ